MLDLVEDPAGGAQTEALRVSIVIVNHNYGAFLAHAIDSALSQRVAAEVIVVDDGSTDGSQALIAGYGGRIRAIYKPAGGHVSAFNAGFAATTGDLVIFLDADDLLYPNCVEAVLKSWRPSYVKLQYRLDTIDKDGVDQGMPFPYFPDNLDADQVRRQSVRFGTYPWPVSSGNAFARSMLRQLLPIDQRVIYRSPDGYVNKLAPLVGDVGTTQEVLGAYRVHGANAWAQVSSKLDVTRIQTTLAFDQVLHRSFEAEARRRSIAVTPIAEVCTVQLSEYELLAHRFANSDRAKADTGRLLARGLRAALIAPNTNPAGRAMWACWLTCIAVLPRSLVRRAYATGRGQAGRAPVSRLLLRFSRGSAR